MGNGFSWFPPLKLDSNNITGYWMRFCNSIPDFLMAKTLWQGGPPPHLFWNNSGNSVWSSAQFGAGGGFGVGDFYTPSFSSTVSTNSSGTVTTTPQTQAERDQAEAKRIQLNKKFEALKKVLQDYASTLDEMDDTEGTLKVKINRLIGSSVTQENYDELLKVYNENNVGATIKDKELKSMLPSEDTSFKDKVGKDCWTKNNWSANIDVTQDNVLQYVATFEATVRANNKNSSLVHTLTTRIRTNPANKDAVVAHMTKIQNNLVALGEGLYNDEKLSAGTKAELEKAVMSLKGCDPGANLCKANQDSYSTKIETVYNLIRKAKMEVLEKNYEFVELKFSDEEKKKIEDTKL